MKLNLGGFLDMRRARHTRIYTEEILSTDLDITLNAYFLMPIREPGANSIHSILSEALVPGGTSEFAVYWEVL